MGFTQAKAGRYYSVRIRREGWRLILGEYENREDIGVGDS